MGLIRFVLAISVVIAHTSDFFGFGLVGGEMAVKLFFMISGFYMALILNEKYVGVNGSYWLFLKNRLLRLYPLYFLILILTFVVNHVGYKLNPNIDSAYAFFVQYGDQLRAETMAYLIGTNGLMLGMDSSLFLGLNPDTGTLFFTPDFSSHHTQLHQFLFVPQSWSISIELMFYFIAPLIVRNLKILIPLLLISAGIALALFLAELPNDPWNYRFFPSQLMYFILGSAGYLIYKRNFSANYSISNKFKWTFYSLVLILTIGYSFIALHIAESVLATITITVYAVSIPLIFDLSKKWKTDRFIGELSYSIYMIHILIIFCIKITGISHVLIFGLSEMAVLATVAASVVLQKIFVEKMEKFRVIK